MNKVVLYFLVVDLYVKPITASMKKKKGMIARMTVALFISLHLGEQ